MVRKRLLMICLFLAIGCWVMESSVVAAGGATPRKVNGTWNSVVEVPPNPVMGNTGTAYLPELDTFSTSGTVITSSGTSVLPLEVDEGSFLAATQIGQGNWKFRGGLFVMTRWRSSSST